MVAPAITKPRERSDRHATPIDISKYSGIITTAARYEYMPSASHTQERAKPCHLGCWLNRASDHNHARMNGIEYNGLSRSRPRMKWTGAKANMTAARTPAHVLWNTARAAKNISTMFTTAISVVG